MTDKLELPPTALSRRDEELIEKIETRCKKQVILCPKCKTIATHLRHSWYCDNCKRVVTGKVEIVYDIPDKILKSLIEELKSLFSEKDETCGIDLYRRNLSQIEQRHPKRIV